MGIRMIRWYDALAAILCAYGMAFAFFNIPIIGAFMAYGLYELWMLYHNLAQ